MISARVIADSQCTARLTTFEMTLPRILLAELNTVRVFSRNCASSRAIPVPRRVAMVSDTPYKPIFWGLNQPGMVAEQSLPPEEMAQAEAIWLEASQDAARHAERLNDIRTHKQTANRILENYCYVTDIVTATEWGNFFNLRVSAAAQPEFDELAGQTLIAYCNSQPKRLKHGDWHIPYGDRMPEGTTLEQQIQIAIARCARVSYETQGGVIDIEADLRLYNQLLTAGHWSPFEHVAQAVSHHHYLTEGVSLATWRKILRSENALWDGSDLWWGNLKWFRQFRKTLPGENQTTFDRDKLLTEWKARRAERGIGG